MSIAGPIDQRPESSEPAARPGRRGPLSRRAVLGAAAAGGVGIAALRVLAYPEIDQLVRRTRATAAGGRGDWVSPLASERARVAHLLRRTTFGATLDELDRAASAASQAQAKVNEASSRVGDKVTELQSKVRSSAEDAKASLK